MTFWLSCCCLLLWMLQWSCCNANLQHKYCIIGAGPSGIQLAYYFQKWKLDYILLERSHQPGNFYSNYPRHGKLISINKRFTGEMNSEFNLRHDWNSLLTDLNLEAHSQDAFQSFSEELFPTRDQMMQYLTAFVQRHQLRVQFQFNVTNLSRLSEGAGFLLEDGGSSSRIACNIAIVAIGMNQPNIPNAQGMEWTVGYEQVSTNGRDFANQKVLILGAGNAAFETAASLYEHTAVVHIGTHNRIRLAWATHYVGDLRAVNNPLLDTYLLKSLDAVVNVEVNDQLIIQKLADNRLQVIDLQDGKFINSSEFVYDSIVRCLGWRFDDSLFNK